MLREAVPNAHELPCISKKNENYLFSHGFSRQIDSSHLARRDSDLQFVQTELVPTRPLDEKFELRCHLKGSIRCSLATQVDGC